MLPDYALIEPTSMCNLKCISCFREELIKDGMPVGKIDKEFLKNLHKILPSLKHIRFHGMGELFILKYHLRYVSFLRKLYPQAWIELVTNGQTKKVIWDLVLSEVNRITFSMSGSTKESYEKFHVNGNFKTLLDNISDCSDKNKVELNFVCTAQNYKELEDLINLAKSIGITNVRINLYQEWSTQISEKEDLKIKRKEDTIAQALVKAIKYGIKKGVATEIIGNPDFQIKDCEWLSKRIMVSYDGAILPCCMRPERKWLNHNIFSESFENYWDSRELDNLREKKASETLYMCNTCPYVMNKSILNKVKERL